MKICGNNWPLIKRCIRLPFSNIMSSYLCGQFSIRSEMIIAMLMIKAACEPHFGCKINCHDNKQASHVCCLKSAGVLWVSQCSLTKSDKLYTYYLEGNDDSNSDCYFCNNKLEIGTLNTLSSTICPTNDSQELSALDTTIMAPKRLCTDEFRGWKNFCRQNELWQRIWNTTLYLLPTNCTSTIINIILYIYCMENI